MEYEFDDLFSRGLPDYSNEKADFWIDESATSYLKTGPMGNLIRKLKDWIVFYVKIKESEEDNVWAIYNGEEIIDEAIGMSQMISKVDLIRARAIFNKGT